MRGQRLQLLARRVPVLRPAAQRARLDLWCGGAPEAGTRYGRGWYAQAGTEAGTRYACCPPEASCPAPPVRAARRRPARVGRAYSTEAPSWAHVSVNTGLDHRHAVALQLQRAREQQAERAAAHGHVHLHVCRARRRPGLLQHAHKLWRLRGRPAAAVQPLQSSVLCREAVEERRATSAARLRQGCRQRGERARSERPWDPHAVLGVSRRRRSIIS
eukprot:scaffold14440_cov54-Phaeocystis_antarctica.AAC.1